MSKNKVEENDFKIKNEIYQKNFRHILNFEAREMAKDAFSTAWDYQQKEIERLKIENNELNMMEEGAQEYALKKKDELKYVKDLNDLKSETIQKLESELKKRDELLEEAKDIIYCCDNSFFTNNLDFIEKVEAILEEK